MKLEKIEKIIELTQEKKEILDTIENTEAVLQKENSFFYIVGTNDYMGRNMDVTRFPVGRPLVDIVLKELKEKLQKIEKELEEM
ncbi:hypothetical protein [Fusobacterium necrophorum]|uniref:hypothetical protein n=1 Tax=Fusobacterium necrophorum TaxID=859 RepID=UPI0010119B6F|nr:hypothetical protein [Fusobacterium necrophorum]RXZ28692.1 hypothetical protein EPT55_03690 [Fusobacterium necrophorum]